MNRQILPSLEYDGNNSQRSYPKQNEYETSKPAPQQIHCAANLDNSLQPNRRFNQRADYSEDSRQADLVPVEPPRAILRQVSSLRKEFKQASVHVAGQLPHLG